MKRKIVRGIEKAFNINYKKRLYSIKCLDNDENGRFEVCYD